MSEGDTNIESLSEHSPMDQFSAHLDRGWDLINRGDIGGAQISAEKSLELDAQSPEAHNLLGYVRAAQGDAEDALEHYRQAIALDDSFVEAMLNAAEVLIHPMHDFDAAMGMVDDALDFAQGDDEVADAMLLKFDARMHQGDLEAAQTVARTLPAGPFEAPRLDFLVGRAHFEAGDKERAEPLLRRAVEREETSPDAHYYLGLLLDAQGKARDATLAFLRSRDLDLIAPAVPWTMPQNQFEDRVRAAIQQLAQTLGETLEGALVVVGDVPGVEIVADGVDPRAGLVLDATSKPGETPRVGRLFVYQRNVERISEGIFQLEADLVSMLETEIKAAFKDLAEVTGTTQPEGEDGSDESASEAPSAETAESDDA